jgi:hypothetical protein
MFATLTNGTNAFSDGRDEDIVGFRSRLSDGES